MIRMKPETQNKRAVNISRLRISLVRVIATADVDDHVLLVWSW